MTLLNNPQWRDANATIAYPFADDVSRTSRDGRMIIPNEWLVDAAIYPHTLEAFPYISSIELTDSHLRVVLADSTGRTLGVGEAARLSTTPLIVYDDDSQAIATLVVGELGSSPLFVTRLGTYAFSPDATEFAASTIMWPASESFQGFEIDGERLSGSDLVLIGERGVQLTVESTTEVQPSGESIEVELIRIHVVGDPQYLTRDCPDAAQRPSRFVREIVFQYGDYTHVCRPDRTGNILLLASSPSVTQSALKVTTSATQLRIGLTGSAIR